MPNRQRSVLAVESLTGTTSKGLHAHRQRQILTPMRSRQRPRQMAEVAQETEQKRTATRWDFVAFLGGRQIGTNPSQSVSTGTTRGRAICCLYYSGGGACQMNSRTRQGLGRRLISLSRDAHFA